MKRLSAVWRQAGNAADGLFTKPSLFGNIPYYIINIIVDAQ